MKQVFQKPYIYWTIFIFLVYMTVNVIISQFYITAQFIPYYLKTLNWTELIIGATLSFTIGALISINMVYSYIRYKQRKNVKTQGALVCAGTVVGLATGICSSCVTGLVPLIFSFIGVSFSFGALPFNGIEVQILTVGILGVSLYWLQRK